MHDSMHDSMHEQVASHENTVDPDGADRIVAVVGRGIVADPTQPVVTADDYGFTRGHGCFEATRFERHADGTLSVDHLDAHLDRLDRSAAALGLATPDRAAWLAQLDDVFDRWTRPGEAVVRLFLTPGSELDPTREPTGIVLAASVDVEAMARARSGIAAATLDRGHTANAFADAPWLLGGVKTLSYAINVAAGHEAKRRGVDDVLFVSTDGYALEAPRSALIWRRGDVLRTTPHGPTGVLASVTQLAIFTAAAHDGVDVAEELILAADLVDVDGAWLVSSGRLVVPMLALDGNALAHDEAWTARLLAWSTQPID